jgi:hypothetical protein
MSDSRPISNGQLNYARDLARRLHLPERMLDDHCVQRFGKPLIALSITDGRDLLHEMLTWKDLPAQMQRAKGQQDLPGFGR